MEIFNISLSIIAVIVFIWAMCKEHEIKEEYKSKIKYIKRTYEDMTFSITLCPDRDFDEKFWKCTYESLDGSISGWFHFDDYPSIEEQMKEHIKPKIISMTAWQKRLEEIENIS